MVVPDFLPLELRRQKSSPTFAIHLGEYPSYLLEAMWSALRVRSVAGMTTSVNSSSGFASNRRRAVGALMVVEALSLAVISALHLSGVIGGGTKPYNPEAAGIAEAVIGVVLIAGAVAVMRSPKHGRTAAQAATGFAIAGFIVGLVFTLSGGQPADIAYHATVLPLLILTLVLSVTKAKDRAAGTGLDPERPDKTGHRAFGKGHAVR